MVSVGLAFGVSCSLMAPDSVGSVVEIVMVTMDFFFLMAPDFLVGSEEILFFEGLMAAVRLGSVFSELSSDILP